MDYGLVYDFSVHALTTPSTTFNSLTNAGTSSKSNNHITLLVHVSSTAGTVGIGFGNSGAVTSTLYADSMMVVYASV